MLLIEVLVSLAILAGLVLIIDQRGPKFFRKEEKMFWIKVSGAILVLIGVGLALDQIIPGWWLWRQVVEVGHHESTSIILVIIGVSLCVFAQIKQKKNESLTPTEIVGGLLALITLAGALLRFYKIGSLSFWTDEIDTFYYSKLSLRGIFLKDSSMYLYYVAVHFWEIVFPNASDGMLRSLSAIFSVAGIPVVYLLGKTMSSGKKQATAIGLVAALLISVNAYNIQYAQELRSYSLVFVLATLSTLLLIKAIEQPSNKSNDWWAWYVLVSVAGIYSHTLIVLITMSQAASLLVLYGDAHSFRLKEIILSYTAIAILIVPIVLRTMLGISGIAWISAPTIEDVKTFAIQITGNQGVNLLVLYTIAASIGLLPGISAWTHKDQIKVWKVTLMASCFLLPVVAELVLSVLVTPIFQSRYLLSTMPFVAVLAANGIVTLAFAGWKTGKIKLVFVPLGAALLIVTVILSTSGILSYFEGYQKEDWRGLSQFLTTNCTEGLRLYDLAYMEPNVTYYNADMKSQVEIWQYNNKQNEWLFSNELGQNPTAAEFAGFLPGGYNQACLVISHINNTLQKSQTTLLQSALQLKFPKITKVEFYHVELEIYSYK